MMTVGRSDLPRAKSADNLRRHRLSTRFTFGRRVRQLRQSLRPSRYDAVGTPEPDTGGLLQRDGTSNGSTGAPTVRNSWPRPTQDSSRSGAIVTGSGTASLTGVIGVLEVSQLTDQPGVFFQGNIVLGSPSAFGDGIRCCGNGVEPGSSPWSATCRSACTDSEQPDFLRQHQVGSPERR